MIVPEDLLVPLLQLDLLVCNLSEDSRVKSYLKQSLFELKYGGCSSVEQMRHKMKGMCRFLKDERKKGLV